MPSPSNLRSLERPIMKKEPTSPVTSSFEGVTNNRPPKNLCEIVKELKRKTEPPPRAKLKQETIVEDVTNNDDDAAQQTTTTTTTTRIKVQPNSERSDPVPASAKSKKLTPPNETAPTEKRRQGSTGSSPDLSSDEDSPPHKKPVPMIDLRTLSKCQKPYQHHHASREEDNSPSRSLSKCQKPYHHHDHASREGDNSPPRMMVLRPMPQDRKRVSTREQHLRNQLFHVQQGLIRPRNIGELQHSNSSKQGRSPLLRRSPPRRPVFHPRGQFNGGPSMRTSPDVDHPHHLAGNGSRTSNSPRTSPSCPPNSPWPPHSNNLQYPRKLLEVLHRDDSRKLANTSSHDQVRPSSNQHSGHHHQMSASVAPSSGSGECCGHRQSVTRAAENIGNWSVAQVGVFLEKVGCGEYTNIFRKHKINGDSLPFLQLKTLLDLGLAMGHAHTIIARVHRLIGTYPDVLLASHNCNS